MQGLWGEWPSLAVHGLGTQLHDTQKIHAIFSKKVQHKQEHQKKSLSATHRTSPTASQLESASPMAVVRFQGEVFPCPASRCSQGWNLGYYACKTGALPPSDSLCLKYSHRMYTNLPCQTLYQPAGCQTFKFKTLQPMTPVWNLEKPQPGKFSAPVSTTLLLLWKKPCLGSLAVCLFWPQYANELSIFYN